MNNLYASRLRAFRKETNYTQMEISEETDITPEYYSYLECGKKKPSMNLHVDFCLKFDKPSDCFFKRDRENKYLSPEQIDALMNVKTEELETILNVLQTIYDDKINRQKD